MKLVLQITAGIVIGGLILIGITHLKAQHPETVQQTYNAPDKTDQAEKHWGTDNDPCLAETEKAIKEQKPLDANSTACKTR